MSNDDTCYENKATRGKRETQREIQLFNGTVRGDSMRK